jgi:hypothetical protein
MSLEMIMKTRATLDFVPRDDLPVALVPNLDQIHTQKAPQLREFIGKAFADLFATSKEKPPGGETAYRGHSTGLLSLSVSISWPEGCNFGTELPFRTNTYRFFCFRKAYEHPWPSGQGGITSFKGRHRRRSGSYTFAVRLDRDPGS